MASRTLVLPRQDTAFLKQLPKKWQHKALHLRSGQEAQFATPSYLLHLRRERGWGYTVSYEPLPGGLQRVMKRTLAGPQRPFVLTAFALVLVTLVRLGVGLAGLHLPALALPLGLMLTVLASICHYSPSSSERFYDTYLADPNEVKELSGPKARIGEARRRGWEQATINTTGLLTFVASYKIWK